MRGKVWDLFTNDGLRRSGISMAWFLEYYFMSCRRDLFAFSSKWRVLIIWWAWFLCFRMSPEDGGAKRWTLFKGQVSK
jgi:hypothetical protein